VSRVAIVAALALASMVSPEARSQDAGAPAPVDPAAIDPATANADEVNGDDATVTAVATAPPDTDDPAELDAWLTARLTVLLSSQPQLFGAKIGVQVVDTDDGRVLFSHNPDQAFNLASNVKVLTAAAALDLLGPGFRWRTTAYAEKFDPMSGTIEGDLYLRGRGDPTLRASSLRTLTHDLRLAGVQALDGDVVFDTSYFDGVVEPPHFDEQPRERAGFRAPVASLSIENSSIIVVIVPDPGGMTPAEVLIEPAVGDDFVEVKLADVATVTTGYKRLRIDTKIKKKQDNKMELEVTGQIRHDQGPDWIRRRVDDPLRLVYEVLERTFGAEDIYLGKKEHRVGPVSKKAREIAVWESAPLGEVVRSMNKESNNFIAESLLKTLGAEAIARSGEPPRPATWQDGLDAVHRWLVEDVGLTDGSFRIGNGSGLFGSSELSPAQMTQVLTAAWQDFRVGPDLAASLAVMGVDGTTRRRLNRSPARGRVRAKTGTLAAVSTLAGYAAVDSRRTIAFAVFVNDIPDGARSHARALQDAIAATCVAYLGGE
jgi:D-alanyl-D-alanine carboxypeptidase/D-alanyl-D-alanine-endopeptidase (penicillin-binding protein 4)